MARKAATPPAPGSTNGATATIESRTAVTVAAPSAVGTRPRRTETGDATVAAPLKRIVPRSTGAPSTKVVTTVATPSAVGTIARRTVSEAVTEPAPAAVGARAF